MQSITYLEQILLNHLRQLSLEKQQEVLDFTQFLWHRQAVQEVASLQNLARLPVSQRHQLLKPLVEDMATDFKTDPELTEFAVLDGEDWELTDD